MKEKDHLQLFVLDSVLKRILKLMNKKKRKKKKRKKKRKLVAEINATQKRKTKPLFSIIFKKKRRKMKNENFFEFVVQNVAIFE